MSDIKKNIDSLYWESILLEGDVFPSVYALCKKVPCEESEFYKHYASLESIEKHFWKNTVEEVVALLEKDEEFAAYAADQKWLSFLFTYMEHIRQYRSRFLARFPRKPNSCSCRDLEPMKKAVESFATKYIDAKELPGLERCKELQEGLQHVEKKIFFTHFYAVLLYFLDDESAGFESTDALIEKSVKLAFELKNSSVLHTAFDLLKFLRKG